MRTNKKYEWYDELSFGLNVKLKAALVMGSFFYLIILFASSIPYQLPIACLYLLKHNAQRPLRETLLRTKIGVMFHRNVLFINPHAHTKQIILFYT